MAYSGRLPPITERQVSADDLANDATFERKQQELAEEIEEQRKVLVRLERQKLIRQKVCKRDKLRHRIEQLAAQLERLSPLGYVCIL